MASPSDAYREEVAELRQKIFLSYSEADQDFMWDLYDDLLDLDYQPFFYSKSSPEALSVSMGNTMQEAARSELAVFCLSEAFFTCDKKPMMEVVECVKHPVRCLPLFYAISVDTIKNGMDTWFNSEWSKWGVDRNEFKEALQTLLGITGMENEEWRIRRARQFRRRVVQEVQKIVPPHILPCVSDICGRDRMVKVVKDMFQNCWSTRDEITEAPVVILGLYGTIGTGKSTLCKVVEHSECSVCYIQLDETDNLAGQLERMKKVLRSVTYLSTDFIDKLANPDEAKEKLLNNREYAKQVFLIIDNVGLNESLTETRIYLADGCSRFKCGSKILITALSEGVLSGLVDRRVKWHIAAMPDLEKEEATQILVKRAGAIEVKEELVEQCLNLCRFGKGGRKGDHFHPLVLDTLAQSFADTVLYPNQDKMTEWADCLESSFSYTASKEKKDVLLWLFSKSYKLLNELQKQVFLDFTFYLPTACIEENGEIFEWLRQVHGMNIEEAVRILERRGLIDLSELTLGNSRVFSQLMHELYYEMANFIVQEEKGSECLFFKGDGSNKQTFPTNCQNISRIRCDYCCLPADLVLENFPSLQVLAMKGCVGVERVDFSRGDLPSQPRLFK